VPILLGILGILAVYQMMWILALSIHPLVMMSRIRMLYNQLILRVDISGILHHPRMRVMILKMVFLNMTMMMTMMFVTGRFLEMLSMIMAMVMMMIYWGPRENII